MRGHKTVFAALMLGAALASPARADGDAGISFGYDDAFTGFDPCRYYRYYDTPPPWGLPKDYCDDLVSFEPVYYDGFWYRGPIYRRHHHGKEEVWLHGGWHEDGRTGQRPAAITWQDSGGSLHGFRADFHPGLGARAGIGEPPHADAAHSGVEPNAHGASNPAVHGTDAPAVHAGSEAPSVHAAAPSSSESHSSSSGSSGGGHESSSGGGSSIHH